MSVGIACKTVDLAGGQQLAGGQVKFRIKGDLAVVLHDPVQPHGFLLHGAPIMIEATPNFRISGIPVCREGHLANCGHPTTGRPFFRIP